MLISAEMEILPLVNHLPDSLYNQIKIISDLKVIYAQSCGHIEVFRALRRCKTSSQQHHSWSLGHPVYSTWRHIWGLITRTSWRLDLDWFLIMMGMWELHTMYHDTCHELSPGAATCYCRDWGQLRRGTIIDSCWPFVKSLNIVIFQPSQVSLGGDTSRLSHF